MWVNGTRTQNLQYNAANQVVGWQYDAAGNLLNDGTQTSTYDALGRVLTVGTTSTTYNADGTLVAQTAGSVTTRYVQDLAAPLSQILADGTARYVYGLPAERLFAQQGSSARTWYATDALGSVRATLNDVGIPQVVATYDAWGVPETAAIAPFGFTGELQRGSDVWLRVRWYGAGRGSFGSRDPYQGDAAMPYSLQYYQYGYSAPTMWTDASGRKVSGKDVQVTFAETPDPVPVIPFDQPDCRTSAESTITLNLTDLGIIIGRSENGIAGGLDLITGKERVYDLLSLSRADFNIRSIVPNPHPKQRDSSVLTSFNINTVGVGVGIYFGGFTGLSTYPVSQWSVKNYGGLSDYGGFSLQTPFDFISIDSTPFWSRDRHLYGAVTGLSLGRSIYPFVFSVKWGMTNAELIPGTLRDYRMSQLPNWGDWRVMLSDLQRDGPLFPMHIYLVVKENAREWQRFDEWRQQHLGTLWQQPTS